MKFKTPILYDKEGNILAYWESEIPTELYAQLKWGFAHAIKESGISYRCPVIKEEDETND